MNEASPDLRSQHYTNTVETLTKALDKTFLAEEDDSSEKYADRTGFSEFKTSMSLNWQHQAKAPRKMDKLFEDLSQKLYYRQLIARSKFTLQEQTKSKVI